MNEKMGGTGKIYCSNSHAIRGSRGRSSEKGGHSINLILLPATIPLYCGASESKIRSQAAGFAARGPRAHAQIQS